MALVTFDGEEARRYGMREAIMLAMLRVRHMLAPDDPPVFLLTRERCAEWWPWWDAGTCQDVLRSLERQRLLILDGYQVWRLSEAALELRP